MSSVYAPTSGREQFMNAFDPTQCAAGVWAPGRALIFYQCQRKPVLQEDGHGWCKQHAPSTEHAKKSVLQVKWEAEDRVGKRMRDIVDARARVVEAAKAWAVRASQYSRELVVLYDAVAELERLEAETQT